MKDAGFVGCQVTDVPRVILEIAREASVVIDTHEEVLSYSIRMLSVEDPTSRGVPMGVIWPNGDGIILQFGLGSARTELKFSDHFRDALSGIIIPALTGKVVEEIYERGGSLVICEHQSRIEKEFKWGSGLFRGKGRLVSRNEYTSYMTTVDSGER